MPYIKKNAPPFVKITRLLRGYGFNSITLASVLGVSQPTAKKRLDRPETLTLGELDRISRFAHIPMEELRQAMSR